MTSKIKVTPSSGNVFADLGLPNPEEHRAKASLAIAIAEKLADRGLTQAEAGRVLGLTQPGVSNLIRGKLDRFTLDRLMRYMRKLDYDVTITFSPKPKNQEKAILRIGSNDAAVPASDSRR